MATVVADSKSVTWHPGVAAVGTSVFTVGFVILKIFWGFFSEEKKMLVTEEESLGNLGPGAIQTGTMTFSVLSI